MDAFSASGKPPRKLPVPDRDVGDSSVGLCATCRHARVIRSAKGSVFYSCELSRTDPCFVKYPRLPVLTCQGHALAFPPPPEQGNRTVRRVGTNQMRDLIRNELGEITASARDLSDTVRETIRPRSSGGTASASGLMDPVRFKRFLIALLKILIAIELISALEKGTEGKGWGQFGFDLVVAGVLYLLWDRITKLISEKKEETARKMKEEEHSIRLWDALTFSLLWSDEIYKDIPADRRRLVVITFTLIAIGLVAAFLGLGGGLMPLVISGTLVLAAVNLLAWVVSSEREEKETLQTELKLAHDVQVSLMPTSCPPIVGFEISGQSLAAREVGGDHFDYGFLGEKGGLFGISVFDVSGKGLHAAMSAVFTSGAFVSEARRSDSPAQILSRMNSSVHRYSQRGHFVAFLLAAIDPERKVMTFTNAGQMKPLLRSSSGTAWLDAAGVTFPLGMMESTRYAERTVPLHPGDVLILLTDGLTEAMNTTMESYGDERFSRFVGRLAVTNMSASQIVEAITNDIRVFVGGAPQHDDMTMVVAKVL